MAKRFFYACAGILCLALAYHLGATNATAQSGVKGQIRFVDSRGAYVVVVSDADDIYVLDPDKPERSLFLLQGDENVLFLLDRNQQLYVGNKDFSYTLNRRNS